MTKCWKWRPSSRPSFSQLVKSLEGAKEALEKTKYVNLVEMVDDLNKTVNIFSKYLYIQQVAS